jgi:hypothetical protein
MATTFYAKQSKANGSAFLTDMARFLINDLATFTGPGWTVIDTYSSAAGTPHEVPGTATDMDSLAADNGWRTGTIAVGDYIILANNNVSYPFQLGIEYQSTTEFNFIVAPKSGFVTGNDDNDMTAAGNWGEVKLATLTYTHLNSKANYSLIADEDHVKVIMEKWPTVYFTYLGLPHTTNLHTGDAYPALYYMEEAQVYLSDSYILADKYRRISPVDDTTIIAIKGNTAVNRNYGYDAASLEHELFPIRLSCTTAGHYGEMGILKGLYAPSQYIGNGCKGTLDSKNYAYISSAISGTPIAFDWDGLTDL